MNKSPDSIHILLVEDSPDLAGLYQSYLIDEGHRITIAETGEAALSLLKNGTPFHLMLLDLQLPDTDGLTLMDETKRSGLHIPTIIMTGHGTLQNAIEALRHGARDFLVKPFPVERLGIAVSNELRQQGSKQRRVSVKGDAICSFENPSIAGHMEEDHSSSKTGRKDNASPLPFGRFIGTSPAMMAVYEQVSAAAKSNAPVFITGESGTGRDTCAEAIHRLSNKNPNPMITINCAALPGDQIEREIFGDNDDHGKDGQNGLLSKANGSTLFLDEIIDMPERALIRLSRFLHERQKSNDNADKNRDSENGSKIRLICATSRDPHEEMEKGRFRQDLYYQLCVLPIHMPRLKDRGHDVIDIAHTYLARFAEEEGKPVPQLSHDAERQLLSYEWPGNIRQLQNILRQIVVLHETEEITPANLSPVLIGQRRNERQAPQNSTPLSSEASPYLRPLYVQEKEIIQNALEACDFSVTTAAQKLEVSPSTLYRKIASWKESEE